MPKRINRSVFRVSMGLFVISFVFSLGALRANAGVLSADTHQSSAQNGGTVMTVTALEEHPETAERSMIAKAGPRSTMSPIRREVPVVCYVSTDAT